VLRGHRQGAGADGAGGTQNGQAFHEIGHTSGPGGFGAPGRAKQFLNMVAILPE
jgi:hypothetical protein